MPRWLRIVRGMLGTGLAFAVSGAAIIGLIGLVFAVFGNVSPLSVVFVAARGSVLSFVLGLVFSAAFAVLARHRDVSRWSLGKFTALGGGVGLTAFVAMGLNGAFNAWSVPTALVNLGLLTAV